MEEKNVIKESDLPKQPKAEPSEDQYLVLTEPVFANPAPLSKNRQ